ncbi:dTDP-4-dehydrorhamnose reductase [uncultured Halopseudomonas sp.]|uniref:dTDP-4-dehydrorhamnose reductase n=1 Tax=uncultured Halopseudomonas sp. TaxID=2901193 RepID=UPI0030ECF61A|tara:strand:- start:6149 stop:7033 length:885 start_codon:yes stop_codon:yes gene_type:complete
MRVLITGAGGQVGYELVRLAPYGFEAHGFSSRELDITSPFQIKKSVEQLNPDLIINAAAYTAVDKAENEQDSAYAVNRDGVANLATIAESLGIPFFHISTDYVFDGGAQNAYKEDDITNPTGLYGLSKLAGEEILAATCFRHLVVRTSWVFGAHGNNFVKTMIRLGQDRDALSIVDDQEGSPTSAASIAQTLWRLASHYRDKGTLPWGIYHYSGWPACTWFEFATTIFELAHPLGLTSRKPLLSPIKTVDYPTPAKRPAFSTLDCSKLFDTFDIPQSDWADDLNLVLIELSRTK